MKCNECGTSDVKEVGVKNGGIAYSCNVCKIGFIYDNGKNETPRRDGNERDNVRRITR